jgi:peptide-methionine (S)-S-oxide reductase
MSHDARTAPRPLAHATVAGGCFWCTEAVFEQVEGVASVVSGYIGGHLPNPSYERVCDGDTGHAEAVRIAFDPEVLPYRALLEIFFGTHDPTTRDRQGHDVGSQYRSAVFAHDADQAAAARDLVAELERDGVFPAPIVTEIVELASAGDAGTWYPAEPYHQGYFRANPRQGYCAAVIAPKVGKFRQRFAHRLRGGR